MTNGCNCFRNHFLRIFLSKQRLSLQIGWLHKIPIDDFQISDTSAAENLRLKRSKGAASDNNNRRRGDCFLPFHSNFRKYFLPGVSAHQKYSCFASRRAPHSSGNNPKSKLKATAAIT